MNPPGFYSDVPSMVRFHAPAIRKYLERWEEDIEAEDFLRGMVAQHEDEPSMVFQCVKFPETEVFISEQEIEEAVYNSTRRSDHFYPHMLFWRGWSDLFTDIHADCVKAEIKSAIADAADAAWAELFPDRPRVRSFPPPADIDWSARFQSRIDWCHHCNRYTAHFNSHHDFYAFHCGEKHIARPRFEN